MAPRIRTLPELLRRPTPEVAAALVGWRLIHGAVVVRIVETEAYLAQGDAASHSACGRTNRNAAMFLAPGHAYVYLIYGVHHCLNVVTAPEGVGEAVLLRAAEPLTGHSELVLRRGAGVRERDLCRGPGRLCQALGLTRAHDGRALFAGELRLEPPPTDEPRAELLIGPRVGITKSAELPLRFRAARSRFTS